MKLKTRIDYLHLIRSYPYIIINCILLVFLLGIFFYSAIFSATRNNYPIPSSLEILKESKEISSGLSHSFSELMRGRIITAREYNEHGPRIFLFFLLQLFMRPFFLFLYIRKNQSTIWIYLDTGASTILFLITFWPFILRFLDMIGSL